MRAIKVKAKSEAVVSVPPIETHLRVLSKNQRRMVSVITKDWQRFTHNVYGEMFDKI